MEFQRVSKPPSTPFLLLAGIAIVVSFWGICALVFAEMGEREYEHALKSSADVVASVAADIERNLELYDLSMQQVAKSVLRPDVQTLTPELRQMILFDASASARDLGPLRFLDKAGHVLADSTTLSPKHAPAAQDVVNVHTFNTDPGLFVGVPSVEEDGTYILTLSRRIADRDGALAGVVLGSVSLRYFHDLFRKLHLGPEDSIGLLKTDGTVIMRYPFELDLLGHKIEGSELFKKFSEGAAGVYRAASQVDNIQKLFVYRQVGTRPLLVVQGTAIKGIFESWWSEVRLIGALVLILSSLTLALIVGLTRALKKRHAAEVRLAAMAATDSLTGLSNRRTFDEVLESEWRRALRSRGPLSLIMIDVDHFKSYNDVFGHQAGDEALAAVAACIRECATRGGDLCARYGGEEFAVLLPGASIEGAVQVGERIRARVLAAKDGNGLDRDRVPTVSVGVASLSPQGGLTSADLIKSADLALYDAKREGRNRVARASIIPFPTKNQELAVAS